jgi:hypothetical protein
MDDRIPCCAADAVRTIRRVEINGKVTGIAMFDEVIRQVREQDLSSDEEIRAALLKRVKFYNFVPEAVEDAYVRVLQDAYASSMRTGNTKKIE